MEWWANVTGLWAVVFAAISAVLGVASWVLSGWVSDAKDTALRKFQEDSKVAVAAATQGTAEALKGAAEASERTKAMELALEQQRGLTATAQKELLELQQRLAPRVIPKDSIDKFTAALKGAAEKGPVNVASISGDAEGAFLAEQLLKAFTAAGWEVRYTTMLGMAGLGAGIMLRDATGDPPAYFRSVLAALNTGGLDKMIGPVNDPEARKHAQDPVFIVILSKPQ